MKQKLALFLFCTVSTMLFSQSIPMAFEDWKTTDGTQNFFYKNITKTDVYENVYVAGATITSNGSTDILLTKKSSTGITLWTQQYNGSANFHDFVAGMVVTSGGDIFITGAVTNNTVNLTQDLILIKYNSSGTQQWVTTYDRGVSNSDIGKELLLDASGNIYVTGASYNSSGNSDFVTLKFNSSGTQQWASTYDYSSNLNDGATKISISSSTITVTGAVTSSANNYKAGTLKYAVSTGSLLSTNISTATSTSSVEIVSDMVTDGSGNIYLCGSMQVSGQGYNYYIVKLTSALAISWQQTYNGSDNLDDLAKSIKVVSGNVYVTGYSTSSTEGRNFTTIKYNSSGTQQWIQHYNNANNSNDEAYDLEMDNSANLYVAGSTSSDINQRDYYTIKYNSSGTKLWEIQSDGNHLDDQATNLALDSLNNVIVTGSSETAPGTYVYATFKYVQKDVITPTDFNNETPSESFWYYKNEGQLRDISDALISNVKYYTDRTNPNMFIEKNKMSFIFARVDSTTSTNDTLHTISMLYYGSNESTETYSLERQKYSISSFKGTGRDFSGINANAKLLTPNIYPNIDLMYSSNQHGIKYYYIVKPGGDIRDIKVDFSGATSYSLNGTTNELSLNTPIGSITFDRPTAYQLTSTNATVAVTGWTPDWQTNGASNKYKFNTGTYTSTLTLVIEVDQGNTTTSASANGHLIWNTYMGGNWDDNIVDVKLDRYGNIYTLADTWSGSYYTNSTFQTIAPQINNEGTIVMKYNLNGKRQNQVYISSNANTGGIALTVTNDSNIVIVGYRAGSNLSGPSGGTNPSGAYTSTVGPSFIMKLDSTFTKIRWSTRYPGTIYDVDSKKNGDIYLCAVTHTSIPLIHNVSGATNIPASAITGAYSTIVSKFNKNGVTLWSSYVGVKPWSVIYENALHIKVDTTASEFYVFGKSNTTQDWRGYNANGTFLQNTTNSFKDPFIKKFNSTDSMVVSTFYGGNKDDELSDAVILQNSDVCFVGATNSTDTANIIFNPYDGSYISKKWGNNYAKGWITKFSSNFAKKWATLYGDSLRVTSFRAVTTDNHYNSLMIGGYTEGMPNVSFGGSYNKSSDASGDAAFIAFNSSNHVTWASSMGIQNLNEYGIFGVQYNPKNSNLVFGGGSGGNSNYPWVQYTGSYWQNFNFAQGHNECNVGRFDATYIMVGVKEIKNSAGENLDIVLYPNPTNSSTNLYFKKGLDERVTITMYNSLGQVMETKSYKSILDNTTLNFNTVHLAEGIYFMTISSESGAKTLKFVTFK